MQDEVAEADECPKNKTLNARAAISPFYVGLRPSISLPQLSKPSPPKPSVEPQFQLYSLETPDAPGAGACTVVSTTV